MQCSTGRPWLQKAVTVGGKSESRATELVVPASMATVSKALRPTLRPHAASAASVVRQDAQGLRSEPGTATQVHADKPLSGARRRAVKATACDVANRAVTAA